MKKKFKVYYKPDIKTKEGALKFEQQIIDDELYFVYDDLFYPFQIPFLDDDWLIQEFTGRLDKNRVEIYDGDIIKFKDMPYSCKYSEEKQAYVCVSEKEDFHQNLSEFSNVEVIGNIMETPNLLNK